jgi:hypothetical protein
MNEHVARYLRRLEQIRWLRPDPEMSALGPPARAWIDQRVGELCQRCAQAPPRGVFLTRSQREARARSGHATSAEELTDFSPAAGQWLHGLEHIAAMVYQRVLGQPDGDALLEATEREVWQVLRALTPEAPDKPSFGQAGGKAMFAIGAPGGYAAVLHAFFLLAHGSDGEALSPWEPLTALWERGLCTLPGLDGTLVLYVPELRDGQLVSDVSAAEGGGFHAGIYPPSPWAAGRTKPRAEGNARALLKRFNRVGLGPLPALYPPAELSFPGMTNWPGPPDVYVTPPPAESATPVRKLCDELVLPATFNPVMPDSMPPSPGPRARDTRGATPWYRALWSRWRVK